MSLKPPIVAEYKQFQIYLLTRDLAEEYAAQINSVVNQIPLSASQTREELLSDFKGERKLHEKWKHSLIGFDENQKLAGVIIASEREKENNEQYSENCIYINSFAVNSNYQKQGLGKFLLQTFISYNSPLGFKELSGKLKFAVQTNSEDWNNYVQNLYESVGFKKTATKAYDNRVDNVYFLED